jgi:uncharacterized protein YjbJ (UPF0337 family)
MDASNLAYREPQPSSPDAAARIIKTRGTHMDWNRIEGNWKQFKGNVQQQWGKLTDDHLDMIAGKRDQLSGKIQEMYGITRDEAQKQLFHWQKSLQNLTDEDNAEAKPDKKVKS